MRFRRLLAATWVLVIALSGSALAAEGGAPPVLDAQTDTETRNGAFVYRERDVTNTVQRDARGTVRSNVAGSGVRVLYRPVCQTTTNADSLGTCRAVYACPEGSNPLMSYRVHPDGRQEAGDHVCAGPGEEADPIDIAEVDAAVRAFAHRVVPGVASVSVEPPGSALVNLPTIFAAQGGSEPFSESFTALGLLPVRVDLRPVSWSWTVDGRPGAVVSDHPGNTYDGTRVRTASGGISDHYVGTTFRRTGQHSVAVTVTWTGTYTAEGVGTRDFGGTVTRTSPTTTFGVAEARSELVRSR